MDNYGILSVVPAILVVIFALKTRRTLEALLAAVSDSDNQWILMVCGLFGSLIALLRKSKGTLGFAGRLEKYCNTGKKTLFVTWILGIIIFIDEYLNIMTLGACMKSISDKKKIPRESLAYIIDSTGTP